MPAQVLNGRAIALDVRKEVAARHADFLARSGRPVGLVTVRVGEDPASAIYVRNKLKAAEKAGIRAEELHLDENTSQEALLRHLDTLNERDDVDAVLVQLPLPNQIDENTAINRVSPGKDVDGFHPMNAGALFTGRSGTRSCTPLGCLRLLDEAGINLKGKHAVVVGRSNIVGKPVAMLLLERHATVTICHSRTADLADHVGRADVVIAAVGRARIIQGAWIKPGATVIDVGMNRLDDGSLCGDVDYEGALDRAGWITPVPKGVGPMTIALLLQNAVECAERNLAAG